MTRVIIVDEATEVLQRLRDILQGQGWEVDEAADGDRALTKSFQAPPLLILARLRAAAKDGCALLRTWKADVRLKDIPFVIYASPSCEPRHVVTAVELGADGLILPSAGPEDWTTRLERILVTIHAGHAGGNLAARQSQRMLLTVMDNIPQGVFWKDLDSRYLGCNRVVARSFGLASPEEIIGKLDRDLTPLTAEQAAFFVRKDREVMESGQPQLGIIEQATVADGSTLWLETNKVPLRDEAGNTIGVLGTWLDISSRLQAETALRDNAERLRLAVQASNVGLWDWNIQTGTVIYSPEWKSQLGYDDHDIASDIAEWEHRLHPDDRLDTLQQVRQYLAKPEGTHALEFRMRHQDGSYRWIYARGEVICDPSGKPVRMLGCHLDITERKRSQEERDRLQAELIQAQKMESIGRLAGGVAHDFNNLLTVINGYSLLALSTLQPGDPLRPTVEEIYKAGERAAALTSQLLAFSRKQVLQPRVLDINRLVEDMRKMLERLMGEAVEIRISLRAPGGIVRADPHRLAQVIMNLVVNARDAMPQGGTLLIETDCVEIGADSGPRNPAAHAGRYVMLMVSDTGEGMDEETRHRIFEPFFTTKGLGQGTGLGLSMVQGIVAQSGGYIEVSGESGKGTRFNIYLPAISEAPETRTVPAAPPPLAGNETVLVVEDQAEVRELAVAVLEAYGYRTLQAQGAREALSIFESEWIHLLLVDVVMPEVSGPELAGQLQKMRPGVKVLFMSGYAGETIPRGGGSEEGANFVQKPFSPAELAAKVREMLVSPPNSNVP